MNADEIPEKHLVGPFSSDVFPIGSGVYIREHGEAPIKYYAYYSIDFGWSPFSTSLRGAKRNSLCRVTSMFSNLPWYGITREFYEELLK